MRYLPSGIIDLISDVSSSHTIFSEVENEYRIIDRVTDIFHDKITSVFDTVDQIAHKSKSFHNGLKIFFGGLNSSLIFSKAIGLG